jgi:hypothetical protein
LTSTYLQLVYEDGDGIKLISIILTFHFALDLRRKVCVLIVKAALRVRRILVGPWNV